MNLTASSCPGMLHGSALVDFSNDLKKLVSRAVRGLYADTSSLTAWSFCACSFLALEEVSQVVADCASVNFAFFDFEIVFLGAGWGGGGGSMSA